MFKQISSDNKSLIPNPKNKSIELCGEKIENKSRKRFYLCLPPLADTSLRRNVWFEGFAFLHERSMIFVFADFCVVVEVKCAGIDNKAII